MLSCGHHRGRRQNREATWPSGGTSPGPTPHLTRWSTAGEASTFMTTDRPLRIALLAYRGKPHCGGQGVYIRHLAKALVDLGHHVEVLGGQPYPMLDERVRLIELPSLDIYNDHFPMRMPGVWELKHWEDWRRGRRLLRRHVPRAARVLDAGLGPPPGPQGRLRHRPRQPVPRLRPARHPAHGPAGDRHDPPPDHGRPPARDGARRDALPALHAAPLVLLHRHADPRRQAPAAGHHGVGELVEGHPPRPQGALRPHAHRARGRRPRAVPARRRACSAPPAC